MKSQFREMILRASPIFKNVWATKTSIAVHAGVMLIAYCTVSSVTGNQPPILSIFLGTLIGSVYVLICVTAYEMGLSRRNERLAVDLKSAHGHKYKVTTLDGANIGELDAVSYLQAKFKTETCSQTIALQAANGLWVALHAAVQALISTPVLLIMFALIYQVFSSNEGSQLSMDVKDLFDNHLLSGNYAFHELTLGLVLESNIIADVYLVSLAAAIFAIALRGYKNAPGYTSYFELKLRRLLSEDLPNIANARGFVVIAINTPPSSTARSHRP